MVARETPPKMELEPTNEKGNHGKRLTTPPRFTLEKELRYLTDPLELAKRTVDLLRSGDHAHALELVRLASRTMPCTVSWNHIIDFAMSKDRVNDACKTYNEMKKRAQPPDAYTYTILLRGLAAHSQYPQSLPRALKIYNSMYAANSPVRPSLIHTNAILNVCAQAKDVDTIFEIAAKMPSDGKGAPNTWTFTTIINAITHAAQHESEILRHYKPTDPGHAMKPIQRAIIQGRRMWVEIIEKWRTGKLYIDDQLVCAMGRLLLMGQTEQDCDDVLSLVEQTMGIQRQFPRLGDPTRRTHLTVRRAVGRKPSTSTMEELSEPEKVMDSDTSAEDFSTSELEAEATSIPTSNSLQQNFSDPSSGSASPVNYPTEFDPIPLKPIDPPRDFPLPSNATLSLIVNACAFMNTPSSVHTYWGLLTSAPYNITPDGENMHSFLRHLRLMRASRLALSLVQEMATPRKEGGLGIHLLPKTFRIAMSTCVRDGKNPKAIGYAEKLLRLMTERLEEPDLKTLWMFVGLLEKANALSHGQGWKSILIGLECLEVNVSNLRSMLAYGSWRSRGTKSQTSHPTTFQDLDDPSPSYTDGNDPKELSRSNLAVHHPSHPSYSPEIKRNVDLIVKGRNCHPDTRVAVRQIMQRMVALCDLVRTAAGESLSDRERKRLNTNRARLQGWIGREMDREGLKERDFRRRKPERREDTEGGDGVKKGAREGARESE